MKTRSIRIEGNLAYVTLTQGYIAVVDSDDAYLVEGFNWCAQVSRSTVYARRSDCTSGRGRFVLMHRLISTAPDDMHVDHIDGDGLNNCRSNMRLATNQQNQHNQGIARHNTSGFKGVYFHNRLKKWQAGIKMNNIAYHLGTYSTAELAHAAYVEASARLHGEFSRTS